MHVDDRSPHDATSRARLGVGRRLQSIRVLLVEDDDVDAELLGSCVTASRGRERVRISRVVRVQDALELLAGPEPVDLVLLDLGLPDSQGLETLRRVQGVADVPVVVLTGAVDDEIAQHAVEAGAQDFIGKDELPDLHLGRVMRSAIERHRLRTELEASELRFRSLVEFADDAMTRVRLEPELLVEYISPALSRITGLPDADLRLGLDAFAARIHPDDRATWWDMSRLEDGGPHCLVFRWQRPDGTWLWLEERRTPIEAGGRLTAMQGIIRDLTPQRQAELRLHEALQQEQTAVERLQRLDELKSTFLQAVSHELRTPLTTIHGFALTLRDHAERLPHDQRTALLDRLAAASVKLRQLLDDLLDVERLNRGIAGADRSPTDLGELVRRVVADIDHPGHGVSVDCPGSGRPLLDGPKVERIIENLVANAVKHTPAGTHVQVRVRQDDERVNITVSDDGPGVDLDDLGDLFEPFVQGRGAKDHPSPGTGIGLALVQRFAALHGGSARVTSSPGGGTTFVVELPTSDAARRTEAGHVHGTATSSDAAETTRSVVAGALRRMLRATTTADVSQALLVAVQRLGGSLRLDRLDGPDVIPLDLSLGVGRPVVAVAVAGGAVRAVLEAELPQLVEDAQLAARTVPGDGRRLSAAGRQGAEDELASLLHQLTTGDALLRVRFEVSDHGVDVLAARSLVRRRVRAFDRVLPLDEHSLLVILPQAERRSVEVVMSRLREVFDEHLPGLRAELQLVMVDSLGGAAAHRRLERQQGA